MIAIIFRIATNSKTHKFYPLTSLISNCSPLKPPLNYDITYNTAKIRHLDIIRNTKFRFDLVHRTFTIPQSRQIRDEDTDRSCNGTTVGKKKKKKKTYIPFPMSLI